jgi:hypothetical protein
MYEKPPRKKYEHKEKDKIGKITKEMIQEFWKHDINPITGLKTQVSNKTESFHYSSFYLDRTKI